MKKILYLIFIFLIGLSGCISKIDFSKIVPKQVNRFATGFIYQVHEGNIDSCLNKVSPEMNNEKGNQYLTKFYLDIQKLPIDICEIIQARRSNKFGNNAYTDYEIEYEYKVNDRFLYVIFGIKEQNSKLMITSFLSEIKNESLLKVHDFTLKNKGFFHYLFMFFAILIPIFILITLIFAIKIKMKKKWLWIVGIIFGIIKFSINWTTGQIGFNLINISIFGAGISKSGNIAPWILSFSLPIVALIFWTKKFKERIRNQSLQ